MTPSALVRIWVKCFVLGCLFAGPMLFLVGTGIAVHEWWFIRHAVTTQGAVVNLVAVQNEQDHSTNYRPVFAFKTSDGVTHTIEASTASNPPGFEVGQHVPVLFNAANPEEASIDSLGQLWFVPIVWVALGAIAFACGIVGKRLLARGTRQVPAAGLKANSAEVIG